jgi:hypothetical protein
MLKPIAPKRCSGLALALGQQSMTKSLVLSEAEVEALLSDLCIRLGFCLPPGEYERLATTPPSTVDAFTRAVFIGEGMNPDTADKQLLSQVRAAVSAAFSRSRSSEPNQSLNAIAPKDGAPH